MIKLIGVILTIALFLSGCATLIVKGIVKVDKDGKVTYVPKEYIKIKGAPGGGKFSDETEGHKSGMNPLTSSILSYE